MIHAVNSNDELDRHPVATDLLYFKPNAECLLHACARKGNLKGVEHLQKLGWSDFACPSRRKGWNLYRSGCRDYSYEGTGYNYDICNIPAYIDVGQRVVDVAMPAIQPE